MYGIDLLMKEHENIVALTKHLRRTCCAVIEGADIDVQEFLECIDFARTKYKYSIWISGMSKISFFLQEGHIQTRVNYKKLSCYTAKKVLKDGRFSKAGKN